MKKILGLFALLFLNGSSRLPASDATVTDLKVNNDATVSGNLFVDGSIDMLGNTFNFGITPDAYYQGLAMPGLCLEFSSAILPGDRSASSILRSKAGYAEGGAYWSWEHNTSANGSSAWAPVMELKTDNSGNTDLKINGQKVLTSGDLAGLGSLNSTGTISASAVNIGTNGWNYSTNSSLPGFTTSFSLSTPPGGSPTPMLKSIATSAPGGAYWSWELPPMNGQPNAAMELKADHSGSAQLTIHGGTTTGTGLISTTPGQVVVGSYNDTSIDADGTDHGKGVFIVGAGSGVKGGKNGRAERQNALRILEDGTILVRPQGDISMGPFTNGPKP